MASLDDLKKRITSVKSTQKITKAMKMVAAAKLKRAQESAEKGRPYSEKMNNVILNLSNGISDKETAPKLLSGTGKDKIHLCVVMTSDRGLCGGFNSNIIKKAKTYFGEILKEGKEFKCEVPSGHNSFVYILKGDLKIGKKSHEKASDSNLVLLERGSELKIKAEKNTEFLFIAGKPIGEPIARGGPFVMNTKAEILEAIQDYNNGTFAKY